MSTIKWEAYECSPFLSIVALIHHLIKAKKRWCPLNKGIMFTTTNHTPTECFNENGIQLKSCMELKINPQLLTPEEDYTIHVENGNLTLSQIHLEAIGGFRYCKTRIGVKETSVWGMLHRPQCDPFGMEYFEKTNIWCDIDGVSFCAEIELYKNKRPSRK